MAVTYVGAGTYQAGNNTSLTPPLPSGVANGDLLLILAAYREDTATSIPTPSGWTAGPGGLSTGAAVEMRIATFYRTMATGVTAPTITFSGGGSNDTTQAQMLAFRGAGGTVSRRNSTFSSRPLDEGTPYLTGPFKAGDAFVCWRADTNDGATGSGTVNWALFDAGPDWVANYTFNNTALGSDADLGFAVGIAPADFSAWTGPDITCDFHPTLGATNPGLTDVLYIPQPNIYTYTPTGGPVVGGAATASYRATKLTVAGTGGAVVGGAAGIYLRNVHYTVPVSGGLVVGGAAPAQKRSSILLHTGSGGPVVGGSAQVTLIQPKNYYIDPFNGDDALAGTSWATALKTFHPIAEGTITVNAGDRVRIAKTPDAILWGTAFKAFNAYGKANNIFRYGWLQQTLQSITGLTDTHLKIIEQSTVTTGWVVPDSSKCQIGTYLMYPYNISPTYFQVFGTFVANQLVAYKPLAATANLSTYNRVEFRCTPLFGGSWTNVVPWTIALSLCSDAAGATELLRITIDYTKIVGGVYAYDGTLPDGVNSIAIRTISNTAATQSAYVLFSIIACKTYGGANYVGHFTQMKWGNHEGSTWAQAHSFQFISSTNYIVHTHAHTGAGALHNTSQNLYTRQAVSWFKTLSYDGSMNDWPLVSRFGVRAVANPVLAIAKTHFDVIDMAGIASAPIDISGGWDTTTTTVTGKTALVHRTHDASSPGESTVVPAFYFAGSSYIKFSNIDVWTNQCSMYGIENNNNGIRFENCELVQCSPTFTIGYGTESTVQHQYLTFPTLTNAYFKNCYGNAIYLFSRQITASSGNNINSTIEMFKGLTMETCVISPWVGAVNAINPGIGYNTPITMVGDLKIYCVANETLIDTAAADQFAVCLPSIKSGMTDTLRVWGGGAMFISPVTSTDGVIEATYTFPKMVLENTFPIFTTIRQLVNSTGSYVCGGDVEYMEVPEITINTTNVEYNQRQPSFISNYNPTHLVGVHDVHTPPIHIKKLTHAGGWYASSSERRCGMVYTYGGPWQISTIDLTGSNSNWNHYLVNQGTTAREDAGVYGERFGIINGLTASSKAYAQQVYMVGLFSSGLCQGILDLRNISMVNTGGLVNYASMGVNAGARVRFKGCTITSTAGDYYTQPGGTNFATSYASGQNGFDGGVIWEDCSMTAPTTHTTGMATSTNTEFSQTSGGGVVDLRNPLTVIKNTPTLAHGVYYYQFGYVEKDYSTFPTGQTFAWKAWSRFRLASPLSYNMPLATVPLRVGKTVTITLKTRRGNTSTFPALIVHHNGTKGFSVATDFKEVITLNTGTINTWVTLQVQYVVQRSGIIDIAYGHFGVEGQPSWFQDLRVVES